MNMTLFDTYNLRARLCVSIFYAAPFIFDIICLTHKAFTVTEGIVLSTVCVTVCQASLSIHRVPTNGQPVKNTAAELLLPSSTLPEGTRARYYRKLASFEPEFQPLLDYINFSSHNPESHSSNISKLCNDVISWLRAKTRNAETFRLVHEENINYGYIRNMQRLKPIGIRANLFAAICFGIYIIATASTFTWNEQGIYYLHLVVHLILCLYLHRCINNSSVDAAATRYAYALLETIDIL